VHAGYARLAFFLCGFLFLVSCRPSIGPEAALCLPNGVILDTATIMQLKEFEDRRVRPYASDTSSRNIQTLEAFTPEEIEAIKSELVQEFGEEAYSYFGEEEFSEIIYEDASDSRTIVGLPSHNGTQFRTDVMIVRYWGPWWCYFEVKFKLQYYNVYEGWRTVTTFGQASAGISDEVTANLTKSIDMLAYIDPANLKAIIYRDTVEANGGLTIRGNTKYGFFPIMNYCKFWHEWYGSMLPANGMKISMFMQIQA